MTVVVALPSLFLKTAMVNDMKGLKILLGNCCEGSILLTQTSFEFLSMTLPNMLTMWFCGDIYINIPPERMFSLKYVKHPNREKQEISNMKYLVKQVIRAVGIVNRHDLVLQN